MSIILKKARIVFGGKYTSLLSLAGRKSLSHFILIFGIIKNSNLMKNEIPTFWWNGRPNFGDLLTKLVFSQQGINVCWSPPDAARLVGIGSILEHLPESSNAIVLGAGLMHEKSRRFFPNADFLAVRGKLSAKILGLNLRDAALGDPGIIIRIEEKYLKKKFRVGLIPHYVDKNNIKVGKLKIRLGNEFIVIDVENPSALETARIIASCSTIISSSLHGLVVAWGLGIPCAWVQLSSLIVGKGFKFRDFYSAFNIKCIAPKKIYGNESISELELLCAAPPKLVSKRQESLISAFAKARNQLSESQGD